MPPLSPRTWLTGRPRFTTTELSAVAEAQGPEAALRAGLARHGKALPQHLEGGFALALEAEDGRCLLAVDHFAEHTLCYRLIGDTLHWSARADELAALEPAAELDPQALFDYLYFHVVPAPRTVFRGVYRVPPGHAVWFEGGRVDLDPYWVPRFEEPRSGDFTALAAEFRELLAQSVRRQLDGSPPACFLSGGTDSSTVAGLIGQVAGQPAASYSIGFEAEGYDEMAYARIAARRFGTRHHEYYVTPDDLVKGIPAMAAYCDQPFGNSSVLPAYYCAKLAREDGVSRLLAGDGGDELFGGNARYAKQRVFGWYEQVPRALRAGLLQPALEGTPLGRVPGLSKARSYIEQAKRPLPDRLELYNLLHRLGLGEVFTPAFLGQVATAEPLRHQRATWRLAQAAHPLNRQLAFDWRYTLGDADLPKVRQATALAGVSVGFPFLDSALAEFSMRLPPEFKLKGLKLRWFFKEALRGFLPDEILTKRKQGFGLPFGVWALRHQGLKTLAVDSLQSLGERGMVDPAFIGRLIGTHLPAHPGYYGEMVWILMMLEQWLRHHRPAARLAG